MAPTPNIPFVGPDHGGAGEGEAHRCRIAADLAAGIENPLTPGGKDISAAGERFEVWPRRDVELVGEAGGQGRGASRSAAPKDDRRAGALGRLGVPGRILQPEELAVERGRAVGPESSTDLE